MGVSAYLNTAKTILQKSVAADVQGNQARLEANLSSLEDSRTEQRVHQQQAREAANKVVEAQDRSFFEGVLNFTGIADQGEGDAKHELDRANADLKEATNRGEIGKKEQQLVTNNLQDAVQAGKQTVDGISKALKGMAEIEG
jgi:hypothetical protein